MLITIRALRVSMNTIRGLNPAILQFIVHGQDSPPPGLGSVVQYAQLTEFSDVLCATISYFFSFVYKRRFEDPDLEG